MSACVHHWLLSDDGDYEDVTEYSGRGWAKFYRRVDLGTCLLCGATARFDNHPRTERAAVGSVGKRSGDGVRKPARKVAWVDWSEGEKVEVMG